MFFFDSSAFAKLFIAERGSPQTVSLVERTADSDKVISMLTLLEVRSALRRRYRAGEVGGGQIQEAIALLMEESRRLIVQPMTSSVAATCESVIDRHSLRTLDALQLATAMVAVETVARGRELQFVCADERLLAAAEAEGLRVLNPEVDSMD